MAKGKIYKAQINKQYGSQRKNPNQHYEINLHEWDPE